VYFFSAIILFHVVFRYLRPLGSCQPHEAGGQLTRLRGRDSNREAIIQQNTDQTVSWMGKIFIGSGSSDPYPKIVIRIGSYSMLVNEREFLIHRTSEKIVRGSSNRRHTKVLVKDDEIPERTYRPKEPSKHFSRN
jgi:hypothetical protein